jgi:hypothetical protein
MAMRSAPGSSEECLDIHGLAQVHDENVFFGGEFVHELFRSHARNPQPANEASPLDELPRNISCQTSSHDCDQPTAPAQCDPLELLAEIKLKLVTVTTQSSPPRESKIRKRRTACERLPLETVPRYSDSRS